MPTEHCPICNENLIRVRPKPGRDSFYFDCPRCGRYEATRTRAEDLPRRVDGKPKFVAALSHSIRRMSAATDYPLLSGDLIDRVEADPRLPNPAEQADNLILWLGYNSPQAGQEHDISKPEIAAAIGAQNQQAAVFVGRALHDRTVVKLLPGTMAISLSFDGWIKYEELKRGVVASRKAFMAMPFDDEELDRMYRDCFKPAVRDTGFDLVRVDTRPKAGLIDDHMRVEIRGSRFLIAELTYGNQNVYWEAGYAEGLGRPVIYTCEAKYFKREEPYEETGGSRFDTNHHVTIVWNEKESALAAQRLKDTIRATLPEYAKQTDDDPAD